VVVDVRHAEIRLEGSEWILRYLWPGIRQHGEQRGLARVRHADQADVGNQLELQPDALLLSWLTLFRSTRHLVAGGRKVLVASAAAPAFEHGQLFAWLREISDPLPRIGVEQQGPRRHSEDKVLAVAPGHLRGSTPGALFCFELLVGTEGGKSVQGRLDLEDDIAAFAPIAAIRPALRHKFLAMEMHHAIATLAGFHMDHDLIYKHAYIISDAPQGKDVRTLTAVPARTY
jgi:hypothetical protein